MKKSNVFKCTFTLLLLTSFLSYSQPAISTESSSFTYLKSNLEFLASDELEGREATTRGERLAGLFISEELEKYGVLPFGDSGSYFQNFNMIVSGYGEDSKATFLKNNDSIVVYNGTDLIFGSRSLPSGKYNNIVYDIVFVGYGIFSEDDNYDSYSNVDVNGKVVLILNGTPKLNGEEILSETVYRKFGRSSNAKAELAKSKGAAGIIVLPNEELLNFWERMQNWAISKTYKLEDEAIDLNKVDNMPMLILNEFSASALLKEEIFDYKKISDLNDPDPKSFNLKTKIKFNYNIVIENKIARNVIGLIEGNDPNLENEYLTIGAHYDHVGINNSEVYNGADDNGSGTVAILEVARQLAINKINKRPVAVIFHTAEEKGLKGAKYLTNNSEFVNNAIVHINVDMVGRKSEDSIYCIGASKISSELGKLIEEVNSKTSNFVLDYKFDDPNDPQRLYYRSDHVHYANKGIPIAFFYDYMKVDYHKPTDTVEKINFNKLFKITDLLYHLMLEISNLDHKLIVDIVN